MAPQPYSYLVRAWRHLQAMPMSLLAPAAAAAATATAVAVAVVGH